MYEQLDLKKFQIQEQQCGHQKHVTLDQYHLKILQLLQHQYHVHMLVLRLAEEHQLLKLYEQFHDNQDFYDRKCYAYYQKRLSIST